MKNLRLLEIIVKDNVTIKARFSENLTSVLSTSNIIVTSVVTDLVKDPEVKKVVVSENVLIITTQPLIPLAAYFVEFKSTETIKFESDKGDALLIEDEQSNKPIVIGPQQNLNNPVYQFFLQALKDNIYDLIPGDMPHDWIAAFSKVTSKALYDTRQLQSDNYLSINVVDEKKVRGQEPTDRLNYEGAFEILRVGKFPTGYNLNKILTFDSFPDYVISLQDNIIINENVNQFDINSLILTLNDSFITQVNSLSFKYENGLTFEYDINIYGYQLLEPKFDPNFATINVNLENNQVKLNQDILQNQDFILPGINDQIIISYHYRSPGRMIDYESLQVFEVLQVNNETLEPLLNVVYLDHSQILDPNNLNNIAELDGINFFDPLANPPFSNIHPAFIKELKFSGSSDLPKNPGEYSVDYLGGRVFVYGAITHDGTGEFPPLISYNYRKNYTSELDYFIYEDKAELVANQERNLSTKSITILFLCEETFVPNVDYIPQVHQEILNERIDNKLTALNSLKTEKFPITNVFRIFNETTQEVYKINYWNDYQVYFSYQIPPNLIKITRERVKFKTIINELLTPIKLTENIVYFNLQYQRVVNSSEDALGSSFNTSVNFSEHNLFENQLYFDDQTSSLETNLSRLLDRKFLIDYQHGIVYLYLNDLNDNNFGTITYKIAEIETNNSHIISVSDLYYSLSPSLGIIERLNYLSFNDSYVIPEILDLSDERFNNDEQFSYEDDSITVTQDIKNVRGVYDHYNLMNSSNPINFYSLITETNNNIIYFSSAVGIELSENLLIESGNIINVTFLSDGIEIVKVISVIRKNDQVELWDSNGNFTDLSIQLSGINSPNLGEEVNVIYQVKLNGASTPIVDYNRGDLYIDYTYLADEILVSYEYGDNSLDFHESNILDIGEEYYVTYKYGALRDSLLKNFGSLPKIPLLNVFDVDFPRENYRRALTSFFHNFLKGSTIEAIKNIVHILTEINPEIIEELYQVWSLGSSYLYPNNIKITGNPQFLPAKYDNGILFDQPDQTLSFPVASNLRLEEGALEFWTIPHWDGLDNDAILIFELYKNDSIISADQIWIGASSFNPEYDLNFKFSLNKNQIPSVTGLPYAIYTQTGFFIYYDEISKVWKIYAKDLVNNDDVIYSGKIYSSGEMYQVKFIPGLGEINDIVRTRLSSVEFEFHLDSNDVLYTDGYQDVLTLDGYIPGDGYQAGYSFDGISFMSDNQHYLVDFAEDDNHNRFSIFKDGTGYLNFQIFSKEGQRAQISYDISAWKSGELHHIATSWKLNSQIDQDEMHLFIDGQEIPNIMKYGGRPAAEDGVDRFRQIKPEYLSPLITEKMISGTKLITAAGSNIVYDSTVNFETNGIAPGDSIIINQTNYTIISVNGTILELDQNLLASLETNYTINQVSWTTQTDLDFYPNILVTLISNGEERELSGLNSDFPEYYIEKNLNRNSVLTLQAINADVGDQIAIRTLGLNHRQAKEIVYLWGENNVFKTQLPVPTNLLDVEIVPILLPLTPIGPDNSILNIDIFESNNLSSFQVSNSTEGRKLSIKITGTNVDFSIPVEVTINGLASDLSSSEIIYFSSANTQISTKKFLNISFISVKVKPIVTTKNSTAIEIRETYHITYADDNTSYPKINYSFVVETGTFLFSESISEVKDLSKNFGDFLLNQKLVITYPGIVAETYDIIEIIDNNTLKISPDLPSLFTDGIYTIYNISSTTSGLQNGFFFLTQNDNNLTSYNLPAGYYELTYPTFLQIKFDPFDQTKLFFGSDYFGNKQANSVLDELVIYNQMLSDLRVNQSAILNQKYITTDYYRRKPLQAKDNQFLMLLHMDKNQVINLASMYTFAQDNVLQTSYSLNQNFGPSINLSKSGILVDNIGLFTTLSQGCIEFWINPNFDTFNDPSDRYYFDASSSILENVVSLTLGTVKVSNKISQVLSVYLSTDTNNIGQEYFANGQIQNDFQTIKLNKLLPYQQTPVKVDYVPSGLVGNRFSIFKDGTNLTCQIVTKDETFNLSKSIFWSKNSWHRVLVNYQFNSKSDFIEMCIDGEYAGKITGDINFTDPINQFYLGSTYSQTQVAYAKIDNLRLSNQMRTLYSVAGKKIDLNYNSNLDSVLPVISDVYTTYLLNFDYLINKIDDFAYLKNENSGNADFTVKVFDSFELLDSSEKMKAILESILKYLKPAKSKIKIQYSDIE